MEIVFTMNLFTPDGRLVASDITERESKHLRERFPGLTCEHTARIVENFHVLLRNLDPDIAKKLVRTAHHSARP
ncbi:MAG: hypothetical protein JSU94_21270 [Phycisphaerales bacterium]|nr:MAG: hypothetical protein JSU94_21270 [Phycisphaerales bacterium]